MLLLTVGHVRRRLPADVLRPGVHLAGAGGAVSAGVALAIIGVRPMTLMAVWLTLVRRRPAGASAILAVTLVAAIWPPLQGILLTAEALGFFVAAMMLLPKVKAPWIPPREAAPSPPSSPPPAAIEGGGTAPA